MKPDFESPEWQEAIRLLHKLVPHSNFISRPQDLSPDAVRSILQAYDPSSERQHFALQASEGSGDAFRRVVGGDLYTGQRAIVIPDLGCGWPEYFPFVCNDRRLEERLNEELCRETLLNSKDTLIILEAGVLALFDHEDGVMVATSRIEEPAEDVPGNTN